MKQNRRSGTLLPLFLRAAALVTLALSLSLSACGGSASAPADAALTAAPAALQQSLPPLSSLPRHSSLPPTLLVRRDGSDFESNPLSHRVTVGVPGVADYQPDFPAGAPIDGLSYAIYKFLTPEYSGAASLKLSWNSAPEHGAAWVALADFSKMSWRWLQLPDSGEVDFGAFSTALASSDQTYAAVVITGSTPASLLSIHFGPNQLPVVTLNQTAARLLPGDNFQLDASLSSDNDGSVVSFQFDPENDGTFIDNGNNPSFMLSYASPGLQTCRVRAVDNDGGIGETSFSAGVGWYHTINGGGLGNFLGGALAAGPDEYYFSGTLDLPDGSDESGVLLRTNAAGEIQWQHLLQGSNHVNFTSVVRDSSGNLYCAAWFAGSTDRIGVVKVGSDGSLIWQKNFDGSFSHSVALAIDSQDRIWLGGQLNPNSGPDPAFVAQLSTAGAVSFQKQLAASDSSDLRGACVDQDDNVYFCGNIQGQSGSDTSTEFYGLSLDSAGALRWARWADLGGSETFSACLCQGEEVCFAGGNQTNGGDGLSLLLRTDRAGTLDFCRSFDSGSTYESFSSLCPGPNGGIYAGGIGFDSTGNLEALVSNYDQTGTRIESFGVGAPGENQQCAAVFQDSNGRLLLGGFSDSSAIHFSAPVVTDADISATLADTSGITVTTTTLTFGDSGATWGDSLALLDSGGGALLMQVIP